MGCGKSRLQRYISCKERVKLTRHTSIPHAGATKQDTTVNSEKRTRLPALATKNKHRPATCCPRWWTELGAQIFKWPGSAWMNPSKWPPPDTSIRAPLPLSRIATRRVQGSTVLDPAALACAPGPRRNQQKCVTRYASVSPLTPRSDAEAASHCNSGKHGRVIREESAVYGSTN